MIMIANAPLIALAGAADLSVYAWQYRPLVVVAPVAQHPKLRQQTLALSATETEMTDRNIVLIEIIGSQVYTRHGPRLLQSADTLREQLGVDPDQFAVVLMGKDTGIKLRSSSLVDSSEIFALIDSMPMRQQEMRSQ